MGLRERITKAATVEDIHALLAEGEKYEYASVRTQNAWRHAATRRGRELTKEDIKIKVIEKTKQSEQVERKAPKHKKRQHSN